MDDVVSVLKNCFDPEIPINVWDLGLIYDLKIDGDKVHVKMTLTAPGCAMGGMITDEVKAKLQTVKGVEKADVELVFDPPWTPDRMSDEAKAQLGIA